MVLTPQYLSITVVPVFVKLFFVANPGAVGRFVEAAGVFEQSVSSTPDCDIG